MPPQMFLYYDRIYHICRLVEKAQAEELFDAETAERIWDERVQVRWIKGLLNRLNRRGYSDIKLSEFLGVSRLAVTKWRTGQNRPSAERLRQLEGLAAELEKVGGSVNIPVNIQSTKRPAEFGKKPAPIEVPTYITLNNILPPSRASVPPANSAEGGRDGRPDNTEKPEPLCGRCPLRDRPLVDGRGGVKL